MRFELTSIVLNGKKMVDIFFFGSVIGQAEGSCIILYA